jgi:hypothetical protein
MPSAKALEITNVRVHFVHITTVPPFDSHQQSNLSHKNGTLRPEHGSGGAKNPRETKKACKILETLRAFWFCL